jgi:hypothetical protein
MKYNHKYSSCSRTYSTLRIYTNESPPDIATKILKIKPSSISRPETKGPAGRRYVNGWFLTTQGKLKSRDSRRHIDWILDKIEPASKKILEMQKNGISIDICCFWGSATGNGGPTISPEQMARLAKLNLEVWWDVYFEGSENEKV